MVTSDNQTTVKGGLGFCSILTLIFITLKLTGFIDWSWVWVLAPLWIAAAFWICVLIIFVIIYIAKGK